ncbi:MAG: acetylornithine deacetylase [Alphaproteobacteria bacterium]
MPPATPVPLDAVVRTIGDLVAFDTVSDRSNLALIDWMRQVLERQGVPTRLFPGAGGDKANLLARFGPDRPGGVVLSGHTDVVPVEGQPWTADPFGLVARDNRLYGRGTADMKSFIGIVLALGPEFLARSLRRPIWLLASYDEEVGCIGVRDALPALKAPEVDPLAIIVGEPTGMRVCNAHKGVHAFRTTVTGLEAHSSRIHRGVNAIVYAARIVDFIAGLAAARQAAADRDNGFDPPFTSLHVGRIRGGTALNIVPRICSFDWEIRNLPSDDPQPLVDRVAAFVASDILPAMHAVDPQTGVTTEPLTWIPALRPEPGNAAETLAMHLAGTNRTHVVAYGAEAGLFQENGTPTVICGPGEIAQAHQPDEYIELAQVEACMAFMRRLMDWAETEG